MWSPTGEMQHEFWVRSTRASHFLDRLKKTESVIISPEFPNLLTFHSVTYKMKIIPERWSIVFSHIWTPRWYYSIYQRVQSIRETQIIIYSNASKMPLHTQALRSPIDVRPVILLMRSNGYQRSLMKTRVLSSLRSGCNNNELITNWENEENMYNEMINIDPDLIN